LRNCRNCKSWFSVSWPLSFVLTLAHKAPMKSVLHPDRRYRGRADGPNEKPQRYLPSDSKDQES
jgi:hypothetical protein